MTIVPCGNCGKYVKDNIIGTACDCGWRVGDGCVATFLPERALEKSAIRIDTQQTIIEALRAENANLRALVQGQTAFHSDEAVNEEMGKLRAENKRYEEALVDIAGSIGSREHERMIARDALTGRE